MELEVPLVNILYASHFPILNLFQNNLIRQSQFHEFTLRFTYEYKVSAHICACKSYLGHKPRISYGCTFPFSTSQYFISPPLNTSLDVIKTKGDKGMTCGFIVMTQLHGWWQKYGRLIVCLIVKPIFVPPTFCIFSIQKHT